MLFLLHYKNNQLLQGKKRLRGKMQFELFTHTVIPKVLQALPPSKTSWEMKNAQYKIDKNWEAQRVCTAHP